LPMQHHWGSNSGMKSKAVELYIKLTAQFKGFYYYETPIR
jgi:hypothetical protein